MFLNLVFYDLCDIFGFVIFDCGVKLKNVIKCSFVSLVDLVMSCCSDYIGG